MAQHPGGAAPRAPLPPIKFAALADALLGRAAALVPQWLPGGATKGREYFVHSLWRDEKTPSLSVCMSGDHAGRWSDHGGEHKGGDLLSLYAAVHGLEQGHAAVQIARELGLEQVAGIRPLPGGHTAPKAAPVLPKAPAKPAAQDGESWSSVQPVPAHAPQPTFWHYEYNSDQRQAPVDHRAEYRLGDDLFGYVVRFLKSDGKKEPMPYTWCTSARDGASLWKWKQFAEPRPLYLPSAALPEGSTIVLVEGEKKAGLLQALLDAGAAGIYTVCAWPGGGKAWDKANWAWLAGRTVLLWPDCDAQRAPLTKAERDSLPERADREALQATKPMLSEAKQPGMKCMLGIGARLRDAHACTVSLLEIPKPGELLDADGQVRGGWDCGDAISTDGWDFARVAAFFATAYALPLADCDMPGLGAPGGGAGHSGGAAGDGGDGDGGGGKKIDGPGEPGDGDHPDDEFAAHLAFACKQLGCKVQQLPVTRKLVIAALRKAPLLRDCLGFDLMVDGPCTVVAWPWRSKAGPLEDADALRLGDWLSVHYKLKASSMAGLLEAIDTVADERRFHPVRDWLKTLKHDGKKRTEKWLLFVLGMDPATMPEKLVKYFELAGRFMLMGLVARVMQPGCKFDYSPVLEGLTGLGKSTFVSILVGKDYFSDTHFDVGNGKDGMEQLAGLWAYELGELTALRRADSEQIKQFFSSAVDRYRGAYGRYVKKHLRQLVIFCSTNKARYLYDLTGNRRFWPMWCGNVINLPWLERNRGQLFAEALAMYQAGDRYYPSREEEALYFVPEQEKRLVETAVQSRLYELLTREGVPHADGKTLTYTQHTTFVTLDGLVTALGADAAKSSSLLESQIRGWLENHGWKYGREGGGQRRRGYMQPKTWPPAIEDDDAQASRNGTGPTLPDDFRGDDDAPF